MQFTLDRYLASPHKVVPSFFFFFNDTATTEIYTLSLHDALPISARAGRERQDLHHFELRARFVGDRSEEHTSELQSRLHLVCRLLLEKKKKKILHPIPRSGQLSIHFRGLGCSTHLVASMTTHTHP